MKALIASHDDRSWARRNLFIVLGLLLAVLFWLIEATIHCSLIHGQELSTCMLPKDTHDFLIRGLICGLFVAFGVFAQFLDNRRVKAEARRGIEALTASHDLLGSIIENAPIRVFWKDTHSRYLGCNTLFAKDAGLASSRDVIGKTDADMVWREQAELYRADDQQVMDSGTPKLVYEEEQTKPDGSIAWLRTSKVPLRDAGGEVFGMLGIYDDITECKMAADREAGLSKVVENSLDEVYIFDAEAWKFLMVNRGARNNLGYSMEELSQLTPVDIKPEYTPSEFSRLIDPLLKQKKEHIRFETLHQRKDGTTYPVDVHLQFTTFQGKEAILAMVLDITQRKRSEKDLLHAYRALRTISACNSILVTAQSESELLQKMCNVIVDTGGYKMAWVGIPEEDEKRVLPAAQAGFEDGYLESIDITWDDTELGRGPTGTAVRTGRTVINQDYQNNPAMAPWREAAVQRGYRSSIALPLEFDDKVIAVLTMYAAEANAFNPRELELLKELASDLAYGLGTLRLRIEHAVTEARLDFMVQHDALTGLPNRTLLQDRFELAAAIAKRRHALAAVVVLDIDRFQQINDSLGHGVGDDLLLMAVDRLGGCIRESDTLSRVGGDEFAILLSEVGELSEIEIIAEKIIDTFNTPFNFKNNSLTVTVSIGISIYPDDATLFDRLFSQADTALFQAKADGGNSYHFFTEAMNAEALDHMQLHGQLRQAIELQEFILHYQPQIDVVSGKVTGAEALLRWQHPQEGLVPPAKFIPLAEQSGLIIPLGEWVLNQACEQARAWRDDKRMPPLTVAVNISAVQFRRGDIVETIKRILKQTGLPARYLELELTESILLHDFDFVADTLRQLKKLRVKLSIDDFGTGYSSLAYVKRLAVDELKIDQSFVRDMVADSEDAAIAQAIVQLGHILKLDVIAEGVENKDQLQLLKGFGCNKAQGFLFGRPVPAEEFGALYGKDRPGGRNSD